MDTLNKFLSGLGTAANTVGTAYQAVTGKGKAPAPRAPAPAPVVAQTDYKKFLIPGLIGLALLIGLGFMFRKSS